MGNIRILRFAGAGLEYVAGARLNVLLPHCVTIALLLLLSLFPLPSTHAATFEKEEDKIGTIGFHIIQPKETLYDISRKYDLGILELVAANPGIDIWLPTEGKRLIIPTSHLLPKVPQQGIVINIAEPRLYYFPSGAAASRVITFPIGIGMEGYNTPLGKAKITLKREQPIWVPPPSIRKEQPDLPASVPPGPDNPLGEYAMNLGLNHIVIHGTNRPWSIGLRGSHGCIRLYPEDIALLFKEVAVGTPVHIIDMPLKLGLSHRVVYAEAHAPPAQDPASFSQKIPYRFQKEEWQNYVSQEFKIPSEKVNWGYLTRVIEGRTGIPFPVSYP